MKSYLARAEYYDAEYESAVMLAHDVPFFLDHLPKARRRVLELAVGTARAAIPIAQAGHTVVGVDYAQDLLDIAVRKRDSVGLVAKQLRLIHGDIRDPKLNIGESQFDWVCLFFNTFLAFPRIADQDALLQNVRRHLKPNGRFWLDIFQPDLAMLQPMAQRGLDSTLFYVPQLDRTVHRTTDIRRDPVEQIQHVAFHYRWFDGRGSHHEVVKFDMTFMFPRELQLVLERNGMTIDRLYGNYDGSPSTMTAPRIIASCKLLRSSEAGNL